MNKLLTQSSIFFLVTLGATLCLLTGASAAIDHENHGSMRLRFADIHQDNQNGRAASIRLRQSLLSTWHNTFSTFIETDYVGRAYQDQHSNGVIFNGKPLVPDAPGWDLNQAFFRFTTGSTELTLGRQRINWDNQRFIGSVSFWQNEQTFDALRFSTSLFSQSKVEYIYLGQANRIFGRNAKQSLRNSDLNFEANDGLRPAARLGQHQHTSHFARFNFEEWDYLRWSIYAHDINNRDAENTSNTTVGGMYAFRYRPHEITYNFELEYAAQRKKSPKEAPITGYFRSQGSIQYQSITASLRYEHIDSKEGITLTTPLASLHEFHGWADKFGTLPSEGIRDFSTQLFWRRSPIKIDLRYHLFKSAESLVTYGHEWDFDFIYKPQKNSQFFVRFAHFIGASDAPEFEDETRIFFNFSLKY